MARIIAGTHGGRRLATPTGSSTRPTTDRVREAVFSRLEHLGVIEGARVLDLYAGSGALGLEALSRGARSAQLVEMAASAARVARRNVADLGVDAEVVHAPVVRHLQLLAERAEAEPVDLVLADPPYDLAEDDLAEALTLLVPLLHPDAVVVVERSARSPEPWWPGGLSRFSERRHGETTVWYSEPA
ncbi:MAG: 16S rRNA (guanine(966)-N(2))-methyltransferase RsmD [Mobilicoccus sp.]|nr:16S rRNA (guanine(966)-N(2))-methyltransferase RsmD [Mobilicoccus sp.]